MIYIVLLSDTRNKGGLYMMPCGFSSVCVGACFWIHERYWTIYAHVAASFVLWCLVYDPAITNYCASWTSPFLYYCYQSLCSPVLIPGTFSWTLFLLLKTAGLSLHVLCCILFSRICFCQIQPPFLLDLISHNCFLCSPEPHPFKIETTCLEFSHLGCTLHL